MMGVDDVEFSAELDLQDQITELRSMMGQIMTLVQANNQTASSQRCETPIVQPVTSVAPPVDLFPREQATNVSDGSLTVGDRRPFGSVKEIAETLPEFDPTGDSAVNVEQFVDRVNASRRAHLWDEKGLLLAVYGKLKGAAKVWFDSSEGFATSWHELSQHLVSEFGITLNEAEIHRKMGETGRKPNEKIIDYCFRVSALGRKYKLSDQAIMRYTRDGLRYRELQTATAAMKFSSLKEMREVFCDFAQNVPAQKTSTNEPQTAKPNREFPSASERKPKDSADRGDKSRVKCYNCFEFGHISAKCGKPQRRRRCVDCQKVHPTGEPENCGKKTAIIRRMSANEQIFTKKVQVNNQHLVAFIDTGSQCSMVRRSVANNLTGEKRQCALVMKGICGGERMLQEFLKASIEVDGVILQADLYVVDDEILSEDVMIGQDVFDVRQVKATIQGGNLEFERVIADVDDPKLKAIRCNTISANTRKRLMVLLTKYRDVFATSLNDIGKTDLVTLTIELDTNEPIAQAPYRVPQPKRHVVAGMVKELLDNDIVQPSTSEYASPITLVKKSDGSDRLCVDYRRVNAHMRKEVFPMPNIEERLQDAKCYSLFTTLDLNSGYYQIPVDEGSRKYTAFVTTDGLYEFKRMPFGLRTAPMAFQRLMAQLKEKLRPGDMIHYMDDILIGAHHEEEMFEKLERVLQALQEAKLTLNPKKCEFLSHSVTFLGHRLTADGIVPGEAKTMAIKDFRTPVNVTEIRRFLGLSGYFRKFVPGYAIIAEPLRQLLRKDEPFNWGTAQQNAFETLKRGLITSPVLAAYDVTAEHQVHTDASAIGLAAVLLQETADGWKPVAYFSRSTSPSEAKMHSYELETLAVVEGLERFRYYIYGKQIKVITDCSAVKATMSKREMVPRVARWWLRIQDYDIIMEHRTEARMCHVDALSRMPIEQCRDLEPATLRIDRADVTEGDWLFTMQLQDEAIRTIVQKCKDGDAQTLKEFAVEDGRLFKRSGKQKSWVVPKNLRYKVVQDMHEKGGHLSVDKTIERLRQQMWFPRMRNIVKSCLKSCVQCAFNKTVGGRAEGEYHFSDIDAIPFRVVHVDHLGPFPRSVKRNEHILVVVDAFTKYTFMRAVPNTSTKFVLRALDEISGYFGMPEKMISDRGTAFTSKAFESYCEQHLIKHVLTAVRTPRANGQVERMNRTILSMLLPMTDKNNRWDEGLRAIQWTLNSTTNQTTRRTPHELLFGYQPRDILGNQLILALSDLDACSSEETDHRSQIHDVRQAAVQRIALSREKAKMRFDRTHSTPKQYVCGDLVLVTSEATSSGTSRKLEPTFKGPFVVTKALGTDRYVIEDLPGSERKQRHYSSIYASDAMKTWCTLPPDDAFPDDDEWAEDLQHREDAE